MDNFSFLNAAHIGYIAEQYDQYLSNPDAIEPSWRSFFQGYDLANSKYSLKDTEESSFVIPEQVKKSIEFVPVKNMDEVIKHAILDDGEKNED